MALCECFLNSYLYCTLTRYILSAYNILKVNIRDLFLEVKESTLNVAKKAHAYMETSTAIELSCNFTKDTHECIDCVMPIFVWFWFFDSRFVQYIGYVIESVDIMWKKTSKAKNYYCANIHMQTKFTPQIYTLYLSFGVNNW